VGLTALLIVTGFSVVPSRVRSLPDRSACRIAGSQTGGRAYRLAMHASPRRVRPVAVRAGPSADRDQTAGQPARRHPKSTTRRSRHSRKSERRRGLHSGSPYPAGPPAGVIAVPAGRSGQSGGSGRPRGLRRDCGSWFPTCASHASPRRCSRDSPTYVAALRSIATRSASDSSRRTLPGTPATSTPSGTCCSSASTVPAAMIE
jgi:hypothetical protein